MLTTILKYIAIIFGVSIAVYIIFMLFFMRVVTSKRGHVEVDKDKSKDFFKKDGKVFYCPGANFFELGPRELEDADFDSFTVLSSYYAKDQKNVYCMEHRIDIADAATFEPVGDSFARDKHHAWFLHHVIDEASADSFTPIKGGYCRDSDHVFYYGKPLPQCNPASFRMLKGNYSRDEQHVYFENNLIYSGSDDIDIGWLDNDEEVSFIKINGDIYAGINCQAVHSPDTLTIISKHYLRDRERVYYFYTDLKEMKNSDPGSFKFVDEDYGYSRDKNNLYYFGKIVLDTDPARFKLKSSDEFKYFQAYIDEDHVRLVPRNQIESIGDHAYVYQGELYVQNVIVPSADINSFAEIEHPYFRDNSRVYYLATPLPDANPEAFRLLEGGFACDNQHVWFNEMRILDLRPDEFRYIDGMYGDSIEGTQTGKLVVPEKQNPG